MKIRTKKRGKTRLGKTAFAGLLILQLFCGCPPAVEDAPETAPAPGAGTEPEGAYPRTLTGTRWEWRSGFGIRTLDFDTEDHLFFHNDHQDGLPAQQLDDSYTYNSETGRGEITGEYPAGRFQITNNNQTMHFVNFKNYGHGADFTRIADNPSSLAGAVYVWEGWGSVIMIEFQSGMSARVTNDGEVSSHTYSYDNPPRRGVINGLNQNRKFSISPDGRTLSYPDWGSWGHGFDFYKR
jgi:hypothetical protein